MRFASSSPASVLRRASRAAIALALAAPPAGASDPVGAGMAELLRRSDVAAHEPASFRSRLSLEGADQRVEIEVWRAGESRTLVRFLGVKHQGKYLLYLPQGVYFLAPGARRPVKLPRSYRLHGSATLDQVLGLRYSRDFAIRSAEPSEDGRHVTFELEARAAKAQYPRVRYVVERAAARPSAAELFLEGGKRATSVEFAAWSPAARLRPRLLVLRDHLRGGAETRVELLELEERNVPDELFRLDDGDARRRLEETTAEATRAGDLP